MKFYRRLSQVGHMCLSVKYLDPICTWGQCQWMKILERRNWKEEVISVNILSQIIHITLLFLGCPAHLSPLLLCPYLQDLENTRNFLLMKNRQDICGSSESRISRPYACPVYPSCFTRLGPLTPNPGSETGHSSVLGNLNLGFIKGHTVWFTWKPMKISCLVRLDTSIHFEQPQVTPDNGADKRDLGSIPGLKAPWRKAQQPTQRAYLKNTHRVWWTSP